MKLLKLTELAQELGVSDRTVMNWRSQGFEPQYDNLTTVDDALEWLKERKLEKARERQRIQERLLDGLR